MNIHRYYSRLYRASVHLVVCPPEEYNAWSLKQFKDPNEWARDRDLGMVLEFEGRHPKYEIIIWLNSHKADVSTLVHECFHASNAILRERGVTCYNDAKEAQAYLLEDIFTVLYKKWKGKKE